MNPGRVAACLIALLVCICTVADARRQSQSDRDRAVNETLNQVLAVGSEWRTAKRSFTWGEMDVEVARRLRVRRSAPWERP